MRALVATMLIGCVAHPWDGTTFHADSSFNAEERESLERARSFASARTGIEWRIVYDLAHYDGAATHAGHILRDEGTGGTCGACAINVGVAVDLDVVAAHEFVHCAGVAHHVATDGSLMSAVVPNALTWTPADQDACLAAGLRCPESHVLAR